MTRCDHDRDPTKRQHGPTVREDGNGTHTTTWCVCGAVRTYTTTLDGFMLGGHWIELDGVKLEGLSNEQGSQDGHVP
jgi:hypothetical protein